MKILEDILQPITTVLEQWTDSGMIWLVVIGTIGAIIYILLL